VIAVDCNGADLGAAEVAALEGRILDELFADAAP